MRLYARLKNSVLHLLPSPYYRLTYSHSYLALSSSSMLSYCADICVASRKSYGLSVRSNKLDTMEKLAQQSLHILPTTQSLMHDKTFFISSCTTNTSIEQIILIIHSIMYSLWARFLIKLRRN